MYPSLYLEDAKEFNSLGEGILKDTQSCYVVHERNGQFDLELEYLADSRLSNNLCKGKIIKADAGKRFQGQLFRIYKVNKTLENIIKVYAYHISYDLKYNPVSRIDLENVSCINALNSIKNSAILPFDFNFSTDITHTSNFNAEGKTALECLGGTEGSIIDNYGNGANIVRDNFNIKIMQNAGFDNNVLISYKKNMLSLDHDDEELQVTGVYPFVKEENGIDESNSTISSFLELPEKVIYREDYQDFKVQNVVPVDFSGKGITSVDSLRNNAISHLKAIVSDNISIKVDFLDKTKLDDYEGISSLQNLDVHDKVIVRYLKLDVNYKSSISKVKYNVLTEKYDEIEIGQTRTNLADTITDTDSFVKEEINKNTNFWQQAIEHATAQITGNSGGYVKMFPPNKPSEIFIMDKDDANLAVNVLRINKQGIGFSKNGINGPFETAWTADGTFYADYITAGTLIANIIKAGVLSDHNGNFELDLDNGTVKVNGEKFRVVVNGKEEGIVSQSQFTQTVDNFEFKFNQSGTTNLVPQGRPRPGNYDGWAIENNAWFYTLNPSVLGFVAGDNGQEGYITSNPIETKNALDLSMSIDVMVENNVVDCKVYVIGGVDDPYAYDQIIPIGICSPTNGWVSFKHSFTLNNNIKYVRVRIDNGGNKSVGNGGYVVWFDNVMLLEGLDNFPNYRENADNIYNNITSIDTAGVKVKSSNTNQFARINNQFLGIFDGGEYNINRRFWAGLNDLGQPVIQLGVAGINPGVATFGGTHMKLLHSRPEHNPFGYGGSVGIIEYQTDKEGTPVSRIGLMQDGTICVQCANQSDFNVLNNARIGKGSKDVTVGDGGLVYFHAWNSYAECSAIQLHTGSNRVLMASYNDKDVFFVRPNGEWCDIWGNHMYTYSLNSVSTYSVDNGIEIDEENQVANIDLGKVSYRLHEENIALKEENEALKTEQIKQNDEIVTNMVANTEVFEMVLSMMPINISSRNEKAGGDIAMVEVYATLIIKGIKTIDDVPLIIRAQVEQRLKELEVQI